MEKFKVIVAGSRGFNDYDLLCRKLDKYLIGQDVEIVSGTAKGADQLGERWAKECNVPVKKFPADWNQFGKKAGYIRNEEMAKYADALVAFWDGESRGTMHMINLAKQYNLKIRIVEYEKRDL